MANVLVNSTPVNKEQRNKRIYGGDSIPNVFPSGSDPQIPKKVIDFNTDTPTIPDYSIYADIYGQYPTIEIFTIDELGNRIKRPEMPYFTINGISGLIETIIFGVFGEGVQTGFITISKY